MAIQQCSFDHQNKAKVINLQIVLEQLVAGKLNMTVLTREEFVLQGIPLRSNVALQNLI